MSLPQQSDRESLATSTPFLKQQEELFKALNQKAGRLLDTLTALDRIGRRSKIAEIHDSEIMLRAEEEIVKAEIKLDDVRKDQMELLQALSVEDRKKICEVMGLGHLEKTISTVEETLPVVDTMSVSEKRRDVLPYKANNLQEISKLVERSRIAANPPQQSDEQTKVAHEEASNLQVHDRYAYSPRNDTPTPHGRIEAPRGPPMPPLKPYSNPPPSAQYPWLLNEAQNQPRPQVFYYSGSETEALAEMLKQNLEKQRALKLGLRKSKDNILQMQEDIRRAEEVMGRRLPRVDVNVEAFLRERNVDAQRRVEEGEAMGWERGMETLMEEAET